MTRGASVALLGIPILALVGIPLMGLFVSSSPNELSDAFRNPALFPSIWLSLWTSTLSALLLVFSGTPLAYWLARSPSRLAWVVERVVQIPILLPPAVIGVALLIAFGRSGPLGGLGLPFSSSAVIVAQSVVAAPFYILGAKAAFTKVEPDLLYVAQSLGASPQKAFRRIGLPIAVPGLILALTLAWSRALGEFGATLLFAGNLSGRTQTMPLAILSAFESDLDLAIALSLIFVCLALAFLVGIRRIAE